MLSEKGKKILMLIEYKKCWNALILEYFKRDKVICIVETEAEEKCCTMGNIPTENNRCSTVPTPGTSLNTTVSLIAAFRIITAPMWLSKWTRLVGLWQTGNHHPPFYSHKGQTHNYEKNTFLVCCPPLPLNQTEKNAQKCILENRILLLYGLLAFKTAKIF